MARKAHAHQVIGLAFGPFCAFVDVGQAWDSRLVVVRQRADDREVLFAGIGAQLVNRVEAFAVADRQLGAVDRRDVGQRLITELFVGACELRKLKQALWLYINHLCAVMKAGGKDVLAKALHDACGIGRLACRERSGGGDI